MASKHKRFRNISQGTFIAQRTRVADNFLTRMIGLLGGSPLEEGEGLLIVPCNSIHMFGMKFSIDAVFFNRQWQVVGILEGIAPGQMSKIFPTAHSCLELPIGAIVKSKTKIGDQCDISDAD